MKKIFFQSSLPRSGSTLLQNILAQNPDFYCTPTSPVNDYISVLREVYTNNPNVLAQNEDEMKKAFHGMSKSAIHGFFNAITEKKYILDKSRGWMGNYDYLQFIIEEQPKIVCLVRDLRDVFASNEKNFRKNPHKAKQSFGMGDANTLPKRIDVWAASNNFTGGAIDSINDAIRMGVAQNIMFIKYENLCLYPEEALKKIYQFFSLPQYKHDFDNVPQATHENDSFHGIFGVHKIRNSVEMLPSDANEVLGKDVCDWIYNNYKWFYDYFQYKY